MLRCSHRRILYLNFNKWHCSNKNNASTQALQSILSKLRQVAPDKKAPANKIQEVHERKQIIQKPLQKIRPQQQPLPIPQKHEQKLDFPIAAKTEESEQIHDPQKKQENIVEPETTTRSVKLRKFEQEFSDYDKRKKPTDKEKYKDIAKKITSEQTNDFQLISDVDDNGDSDVKQWIYNKIVELDDKNGLKLPLPQDIAMKFPLISIEKAKHIRDKIIDEIIEMKAMNNRYAETHRIGAHFSNFNPLESKSDRDPFDFNVNSVDGQQNGINLAGLNPATWYGYNNKAWNSFSDCHESCVEEIESEYGKFRALITRNKELSIEMIMDLRRKINHINNNSKTISFGLTGKDRREFIGDIDAKRMLTAYNANITDIACLYFANLFGLIDDIMHLKKPLIIATSGMLNGIQNSLYLSGNIRLCDSSMRMIFNNALYGEIPCGGFFYFISQIQCKKKQKHMLLKSILTNEAITCWDLYQIGFVDWVMPSPNNVLFFNHFGNEIDKIFNYNFKKQDELRHDAMIQSVIQLFDRGHEHYSYDDNYYAYDYIFGLNNNSDLDLDIKQIIKRIHNIANGDYDFDVSLTDDTITNIIYIANKIKNNIAKVSPLALYISYIMCFGAIKESQSQKDFFRNLLSYEYHALCWFMYFGDFWEGLKCKNDNTYIPKWRWSSIEQLLSSKDINRLIPINSDTPQNIFERCIIFNELPLSWMKPLQFNQNHDSKHSMQGL